MSHLVFYNVILISDSCTEVQGRGLKKVRGTPPRWKLLPNLTTVPIQHLLSEAIPHRMNAGFLFRPCDLVPLFCRLMS